MSNPFQTLQILQQEDAELVKVLVEMFQTQAPEFMAQLQTNMTDQDYVELKRNAHTFKGVVLNLGFADLGAALKETENAAEASNQQQTSSALLTVQQKYKEIEAGLSPFIY